MVCQFVWQCKINFAAQQRRRQPGATFASFDAIMPSSDLFREMAKPVPSCLPPTYSQALLGVVAQAFRFIAAAISERSSPGLKRRSNHEVVSVP
jgi:hypothetical protein